MLLTKRLYFSPIAVLRQRVISHRWMIVRRRYETGDIIRIFCDQLFKSGRVVPRNLQKICSIFFCYSFNLSLFSSHTRHHPRRNSMIAILDLHNLCSTGRGSCNPYRQRSTVSAIFPEQRPVSGINCFNQ